MGATRIRVGKTCLQPRDGGCPCYVFKKIKIPLAPFTLALVLGSRAEDAFRLSMIGAEGDLRVFWSNPLVGSITTLALILLFWPLIGLVFERAGPVTASGQGLMRQRLEW